MAEAEGSFKVCGLCSQLVDEAVKLSDELLQFLVEFLGVNGSKLPTKICTECYTGSIESRKFKEKCMRTVNKLTKTKLSSNMILGRSSGDIKTMRNKYKTQKLEAQSPSASPSQSPKTSSPSTTLVTGKRVSKPSSRLSNGYVTPPRVAGRTLSENSGTGSDDVPLSTRHSLRKKAIKYSAGVEFRKIPTVMLSPKDRSAADEVLEKTTGLNTRLKRSLKRKIQSPARYEDSQFTQKKAKPVAKKQPAPPLPAQPVAHKPSQKEQKVVEVEDDEEIFPSVGPYQCEICQEITDTKQQFVAHVKSLHKDMVDEQVLRSLETDLKKRMKKEQKIAGNDSSKKNLPIAGKTSKSGKKKVGSPNKIVDQLKADKSKSLKPKPRPRPKYTENDDEDYSPRGNKGKKKLTPVKPQERTSYPPGPAECDICGTYLLHAKEMPRHRETLKCRQAAFNKSQMMLKPSAQTAQTEQGKPETSEDKPPVDQPGLPEDVEASAVRHDDDETVALSDQTQTNIELLNQRDTNSNDSEGSGHKPNGLDAKFKASIAKRYEAERESGEGEDKTEADAVVEHDVEDTDLAIKQAMQESLATAEKERVGLEKGRVSLDSLDSHQPEAVDQPDQPHQQSPGEPHQQSPDHPHQQSTSQPLQHQSSGQHNQLSTGQSYQHGSGKPHQQSPGQPNRQSAGQLHQQSIGQPSQQSPHYHLQHQPDHQPLNHESLPRLVRTGDSAYQEQEDGGPAAEEEDVEDDEGEQSPAAYIDPNPQPDIEPHKQQSVIHSVIQKNVPRHNHDMPVTSSFVKPWQTSESTIETSTLDLSVLTSTQQHQESVVEQTGAMPSLDSLESQMAALHGPGGANTPWHTFQSEYYHQHQ